MILIPQSSSPKKEELEYEGINDMGDYDEYEDEYVMEGEEEVEEDYEVDYEYVDLQKDSDGDGLRWSSNQNIWYSY